MPLWIIEPVVAADDPAWQGRRQWESVVVRADSPAFARLLCASLDTSNRTREYGDEHPRLGSGFSRGNLYRVEPYHGPAGRFDEEGPDAILEQRLRTRT